MSGKYDYTTLKTDVLIIGAGGAGLRAAIAATEAGCSVIVASKSLLGKAHTVMAEGGIAASLGNVDPQDNWQVHFRDTYVEGVFLGNWRMVELLAKEAPDRVYELERYGALFDRTPEGKIMQRPFGAHTYRRLCYVGDKTGLELIRTLQDKVAHSEAKILDEFVVTKIVSVNGKVAGAFGISMREGTFKLIECKSLIVASGGLGRLFKVTSNSWEGTGDGLALSYRAGAVLMDMEMVQFHPTGMVWPPAVRGILVTEGVRGEGGMLYNKDGERFMLRYSPKKKELDARDVVARSIYREIIEGRGTEHGGVYLDIRHRGAKYIMEKLPSMYMQYKEFAEIDITKEKMEVAPTVHYHMGGIRVNPETQMTNVEGLFAAGEAASGLHGANRLGGNSLTDLLVFGKLAGVSASAYAKQGKQIKFDESVVKEEIDRVMSFVENPGATNPYPLIDTLRESMSKYVGILRNDSDLNKAYDAIKSLKPKLKDIGVRGSLRFNPGLLACLEFTNLIQSAELLVRGAIERKESRGAHFRSDFPNRSHDFRKNILFKLNEGRDEMSFAAVPELPDHLKDLGKEED
ncbi:MAG: FAD-binding protein [Candidatus Thermoplasmatota archaeon]|jgi:succinate dehydrogenase / fumarate reductase flavoprotein subunit|nr:FAD-binding protein [Candidatus Thermoplasmatota archaeon]